MIPKYHIQYALRVGNRWHPQDYHTDDPVACEEFLVSLLEHGLKIESIAHEGVSLPAREFDQMVKNAADELAAKQIGHALGIDAEQVHFRFGFAA